MSSPADPTRSVAVWHSTDDNGTMRHVIVEAFGGLCQVTEEVLADLLARGGRPTIPAGRSDQLTGVYFIAERDLHALLDAVGMVRVR